MIRSPVPERKNMDHILISLSGDCLTLLIFTFGCSLSYLCRSAGYTSVLYLNHYFGYTASHNSNLYAFFVLFSIIFKKSCSNFRNLKIFTIFRNQLLNQPIFFRKVFRDLQRKMKNLTYNNEITSPAEKNSCRTVRPSERVPR